MIKINTKEWLEIFAMIIWAPIIVFLFLFDFFSDVFSDIVRKIKDFFSDNDEDLLDEKHDSDWRRNLREINK